MGKIIKTVIDGIPVELEIIKADTTSKEILEHLEGHVSEKLVILDGSNGATKSLPIEKISTNDQTIRVVSIGDEQNPAGTQDIEKINEIVSKSDSATLVGNLLESLQTLPQEISFWQSKTIWVNIIAIVCSVATYYGLDLKLTPEMIALIATLLVLISSSINVYLRKGTNRTIK